MKHNYMSNIRKIAQKAIKEKGLTEEEVMESLYKDDNCSPKENLKHSLKELKAIKNGDLDPMTFDEMMEEFSEEENRQLIKEYADKNKIDLNEFIKKTGRKPLEGDSEGRVIIDMNNPEQRRWVED